MSISRTEIERELAAREIARRRLLPFILRMKPDYMAGWVHELICAKLERFFEQVAAKQSPRLMFFMPPRTGKSLIVSQFFPAWCLGKDPSLEFIAASYNVSLPTKFSRAIKELIPLPAYRGVFAETQLHPDVSSAEYWMTTKGGGYIAAGVGSGISGKGCNILSIDDPVKDMEAADSELIRNTAWDWWDAAAETRVAPGGGVLVTQTRWNDDDLSGRMLQQQKELMAELREAAEDGDERAKQRLEDFQEGLWEVVEFPAMAQDEEWVTPDLKLIHGNEIYNHLSEADVTALRDIHARTHRPAVSKSGFKLVRFPEEALHPERYDERFYRRKKARSKPRVWSALYQQQPVPDEGEFFKDTDFRYEPTVPDFSEWHVYIAWDLAIGTKNVNDWTVGAVGALDFDDNLHILEVIRVRTRDLASLILDVAQKYQTRLQTIGVEQGQIQGAIVPELSRLMGERRFYPVFDDTLKPIQDKAARARPLQGRMQRGKVILPSNQPWVEPLKYEMLRFPTGVHDDQVDACLSADTQVSTPAGAKKITDIVAGEYVLTPSGPQRVLSAGKTAPQARVYEVSFTDGRSLIGTGNHPVYVLGRGFVPVDALRCLDRVIIDAPDWTGRSIWARDPSALSTTASSIAATPVHATQRIAATSTQPVTTAGTPTLSIGESGKTPTALFRKAIRSITAMATRATTRWTIWSASLRLSTAPDIATSVWPTASLRSSGPISNGCGPSPLSGMDLTQDVSGTSTTENGLWRAVRCWIRSVRSAAHRFSPSSPSHGSAARSASGRPTTELTCNPTTLSSAGAAGPIFTLGTIHNCTVPTSASSAISTEVLAVRALTETRPVYNLEVEGNPVYFANGVLVHNCAWLTRMVEKVAAPKRPITNPKPPSWKDKLKLAGRGKGHMAA